MRKFISLINECLFLIKFKLGVRIIEKRLRNPENRDAVKQFMRQAAETVIKNQQAQPKSTVKEVAEEWQRMFPFYKRMQKIIAVKDNTVYAETHVSCPLRGTGRVNDCYLMMEFDRRLLETIGGQLVVLRSQAEPGVKYCEVALRLKGAKLNDLVAAHERTV